MIERTRIGGKIKTVFIPWGVGVTLVFNLSAIIFILFLFRYSIYCGLGIGVYGILLYVPSLLLVVATYFYKGSIGVIRKIRIAVALVNAIFIASAIFVGLCFSCVNSCVENFQ